MLRTVLVTGVLLLGLSACGSDGDSGQRVVENPLPSSESSGQPSESESPTPSEDPTPRVGNSVEVDTAKLQYTVSALEFDDKVDSGNPFTKPRPGNHFVGVLAQYCLQSNDARQEVQVSTDPWSLRFGDGTVSQSDFSLGEESDLPQLYPDYVVVPEGTCVKGWISFQAPNAARPNLVVYAPTGNEVTVFQFAPKRD